MDTDSYEPDGTTPVSMDTIELHGVKWNRCRRCRRLRPLQRLFVPRWSSVVDTNPPFYQYECRDRSRCWRLSPPVR